MKLVLTFCFLSYLLPCIVGFLLLHIPVTIQELLAIILQAAWGVNNMF